MGREAGTRIARGADARNERTTAERNIMMNSKEGER